MHGLIIMEEPVEQILSGLKTWEIRGMQTKIRGTIALIKKGTKTVVGTADLVDVRGPLSVPTLRRTMSLHRLTRDECTAGGGYKQTHAWVLENVKRLAKPVPYKHPSGAVIWVLLPDDLLS